MQNEKLFDKIKQIARTELAGTNEYDPDQIWARIQKKEQRKSRALWWVYAAAAAVFVLALLFIVPRSKNSKSISARQDRNQPVPAQKSSEIPEINRNNPTEEAIVSASDHRKIGQTAVSRQSIKIEKSDSISENNSLTLPIPKVDITQIQSAANADSAAPPAEQQQQQQQQPEVKAEKVLVASIQLPDENVEQAEGLQRIFEQVKKDREARKMRLQFNRNAGKLTLWSFVHQSFVEQPPVTQKAAQPDQRN